MKTRRFRIPAGRTCAWLSERTNPTHLVTYWPLGFLVRLFFLRGGGCVVVVDRYSQRDLRADLERLARRVCVLESGAWEMEKRKERA